MVFTFRRTKIWTMPSKNLIINIKNRKISAKSSLGLIVQRPPEELQKKTWSVKAFITYSCSNSKSWKMMLTFTEIMLYRARPVIVCIVTPSGQARACVSTNKMWSSLLWEDLLHTRTTVQQYSPGNKKRRVWNPRSWGWDGCTLLTKWVRS